MSIYVGRDFQEIRGHEFGNPFKPDAANSPESRLKACRQFEQHCLDTPWPILRDMLWRVIADTEAGRWPIACWCGFWLNPAESPPACHASIISAMASEVFVNGHLQNYRRIFGEMIDDAKSPPYSSRR